MQKGSIVQFSAVLESIKQHRWPDKRRVTQRAELDEPRRGIFLGWSRVVDGSIDWIDEEVGYVFVQTKATRCAMVVVLDGTVAWRRPVAVLPDDLVVESGCVS